ncbi:MAG: hypothetical protein KGJ66_15750 [Alphaproteobacteria bacterium]|nr:hypothetical protein [Alphaproteobacteria bacterium]
MRAIRFNLTRIAQTAAVLTLTPGIAQAHVKWFAHYSVPQQPMPLHQVFTATTFWQYNATAALLLWLLTVLERQQLGAVVMRSLDRLSAGFEPRIEALYRGGTAVFFTALWVLGDIILTPELKTDSPIIPWLQAAIALSMFWRRTMPFGALGIAFLYAYGVYAYGIFHMLDYPIFLGLAAYLALTGLELDCFGVRPLDIARWMAALTLMWAAMEKWAYPEWTYPVLTSHPEIAMDLNPHFYMISAGVLEFALAFSLLWTPLVRRLAALVLSIMFVSAVLDFGKIDAIGHSMIIVILIGVLVDEEPSTRHRSWLAPVAYGGALTIYLAAYWGFHAALYGTMIW